MGNPVCGTTPHEKKQPQEYGQEQIGVTFFQGLSSLSDHYPAIPSLIFLTTSAKRFFRHLSTFNGSCQHEQKTPPEKFS
jgi:hypothetical protein